MPLVLTWSWYTVAGAALVPVALLGLGLALVAGGVVDGDADVDSLGV